MPPDYLPRARFEDYIRTHESDVNAHGALRRIDSEDQAETDGKMSDRISSLERWQAYITGGLALLTFLVATGVITAVVELLRR